MGTVVSTQPIQRTTSRTPTSGATTPSPLPNGWSFGEPVNLGPTVNSECEDACPALSPDGLTLFFHSHRLGGFGEADIWWATRESADAPFGEPVNLGPPVNTTDAECDSELSSDGLILLWATEDALWMATRKSLSDPFGNRSRLDLGVRGDDRSPELSNDGLTLLFCSDRPGGQGSYDLWMSTRKSVSDPFGEPVNLGPPVNTSAEERFPALSSDGLTLVLESDRPCGQGNHDFWMSTRRSLDDPFGEPVNLGPPVNTNRWEGTPELSCDGLILFFTALDPTGRGGVEGGDLWMARINLPETKPTTNQPPLAIAPFIPEEAKQHQQAWAKYLGVPVVETNSIGMKMVLIPPGEFMMGSPDSDSDAEDDEKPQHRVKISKPFEMAAHEVTVGQFRAFVDAMGYKTQAETANDERTWTNAGFEQTDEHPVAVVSWNDAVAFIEWLSKKEGKTYRLPAEAEWEFSCRSGSVTRWSFGDNEKDLEKYAWYGNKIKRGGGTSPVGQKLPNGFGLFDMHGNVREWCDDRFSENYSNVLSVDDPKGPSVGGGGLVWRGGSFNDVPRLVRSAGRFRNLPTYRDCIIGFRPAQTIPTAKLTLNIAEPNTIVSIDNGKSTFTTPADSRLIETVLIEGKHTVEVSKTGFKTFEKEINVVTDGRETIEVRLDAIADSTAPPLAIAPFTPEQAKQHQQRWAKHLGIPVVEANSIGMQMTLIPPGEFLMGSSEEQAEAMQRVAQEIGPPWAVGGIISALPQHKVRITRPFYLAAHESDGRTFWGVCRSCRLPNGSGVEWRRKLGTG